MIYTSYYNSPIGKLLIVSKNNELIGLYIEKQKYYLRNITEETQENNNDLNIIKTKKWLDDYFKGNNREIEDLNINPIGTEFQKLVWKLLCEIPYGQTTTYKNIAIKVAKEKGTPSMSSQAIGGAVSRNPISIIIPCHRVVGTNNSLTGYAGGLDKKIKLLEHEEVNLKNFK